MLVGSLSLMATPFLTGFYSKDLIIELAFGQYSFSGVYAYILGTLSAALTAFYSFRLISLVFLTVPNGPEKSYLNSHEANVSVIIPLSILALFSIFFGFIGSDMFIGMGSDFFGNSVFIKPNNISLIEAEFSLSLWIKLLPSILSFLGAAFAVFLYHKSPEFVIDLTETSLGRKIYTFLNGKYFFDIVYNNYIITKGLALGYTVSKVLDRGIIEMVGPYGLSQEVSTVSQDIASLDTGIITTYALYIIIALLSFVFVLFSPLLLGQALIDPQLLIIAFFSFLFRNKT